MSSRTPPSTIFQFTAAPPHVAVRPAGPKDAPSAAPAGLRAVDVVGALALTVAGPLLLASAATLLGADPSSAEGSLVRLLALGAGVLGAILFAWWCLGVLGLGLMALGRATGRRAWVDAGRRVAPGVLRRTAAAVLGVQLLAAPAAWADAPPAVPAASPTAETPTAPVDASWLTPPSKHPHPGGSPDGVVSGTPSAPAARPGEDTEHAAPVPSSAWTPQAPTPAPPGAAIAPRPTSHGDSVTVRAGDCLWDIAAAELGPDATVREIDRRWRDWYRENAAVIGDDPGLILPGTVLRTPVFSPHMSADPMGRTS